MVEGRLPDLLVALIVAKSGDFRTRRHRKEHFHFNVTELGLPFARS